LIMGLDSSFPYLLPEGKLAITGRGVKSYMNRCIDLLYSMVVNPFVIGSIWIPVS